MPATRFVLPAKPKPYPMNQHLLPIIAGLCCLTASSHATLIAHYKFDEAAGATVAVEELAGTNGAVGSSVVTTWAPQDGSSNDDDAMKIRPTTCMRALPRCGDNDVARIAQATPPLHSRRSQQCVGRRRVHHVAS